MKSASIAALVLIVGGVDLRAQVVLTGAVRDSGGRPVIGAEVSIAALQKSAIADSSGHYSIDGVTPGMRLIQVRRVGFAPFSKMMRIDGSATVDYVLAALAVKLDTVRTTEQYRSTDIQMMEFLDNKKLGLGKFFTRDDLEKMNGRPLAEAFMQLPGIVIINGVLGGSKAWIASSRVRSMRVEEVVLEDLQCLELDSRRPRSMPRVRRHVSL